MCPFEFFDKILLDSISSWCSPIHLFFSIFSRNSFFLSNFWFSSPLTLSLNYKSSVQSYFSKVLSKYSTSLFLSVILSSRSLLHTATCSSCRPSVLLFQIKVYQAISPSTGVSLVLLVVQHLLISLLFSSNMPFSFDVTLFFCFFQCLQLQDFYYHVS